MRRKRNKKFLDGTVILIKKYDSFLNFIKFYLRKIKKVFNEDTLYKAYDQRCKAIPFYKEVYEQQMAKGDEFQPKEEMVQNLVDDIEKQ